MKILRVIDSMDPKNGGPCEGIRRIQVPLDKTGLDITIVCCDDPAEPYLKTLSPKIIALGKTSTNYGFSINLKRWLSENVCLYDVVIIHGVWQYHTLAAAAVCIKKNIPYYIYTHGMLDPWFKKTYPLKHLKKNIYWHLFLAKLMNSAESLIFTSEEERLLSRLSFSNYNVKETVTSYGTSAPIAKTIDLRHSFFASYPELKSKKILLFVGRIHEKKGCDILLEAFKNISARDNNLQLVFVGPEKTDFGKKLKERAFSLKIDAKITWLGMLEGEMKWGAYCAAEVFCLPSHQENFGIVVAEALSVGTPVIISNKVNIWREILENKAGLVCEDNIDGVTKSLINWGSFDQDTLSLYHKNALNCFNKYFEINKAADDFIKIINRSALIYEIK